MKNQRDAYRFVVRGRDTRRFMLKNDDCSEFASQRALYVWVKQKICRERAIQLVGRRNVRSIRLGHCIQKAQCVCHTG